MRREMPTSASCSSRAPRSHCAYRASKLECAAPAQLPPRESTRPRSWCWMDSICPAPDDSCDAVAWSSSGGTRMKPATLIPSLWWWIQGTCYLIIPSSNPASKTVCTTTLRQRRRGQPAPQPGGQFAGQVLGHRRRDRVAAQMRKAGDAGQRPAVVDHVQAELFRAVALGQAGDHHRQEVGLAALAVAQHEKVR